MEEQVKVPSMGLGTFLAKDNDVKNAIHTAIETGYKLIDTATIYENENEVGEAIKTSGCNRNDIFITSKVWNSIETFDDAINAYQESCSKLGVEYLDLYLIHWPGTKERNAIVWSALEHLLNEGKVRAIGVSNFQKHHLYELFETAETIPMMNQVEIHPHLNQIRLQEFCTEHGISLTAYGTFARGHLDNEEKLLKIAKKHNVTIQQIILRWLFQRNIFTIPKSVTPERIKSNFEIQQFKLSMDEMNIIYSLNCAKRYYPDPDNISF